MEKVTDLDEAKLLGYFESIKGVFLTKFVFVAAFTKKSNGTHHFDAASIPREAIDYVKHEFDDPVFYKALEQSNPELHANFIDDLVTSLLTSSWNIFEQITKDLTSLDYSTKPDDLSVCYTNGKFQFDKREKKDIELFYYIRNATHHYNGAYYAGKDIDHRYAGIDFKSSGHYGEKIPVNIPTAYQMSVDMERYTIKAWQNAANFSESAP